MPTLYECLGWIVLAQDAGEAGGGNEGAPGNGNGNNEGLFGGNFIYLFIGLAMLWFIMMVLPQRRDQKKAKEMLETLKKNDRVLFAGGICGTVANIHQDGYVTIRIDDSSNAKMRVLRGAISRVITDDDDEKKEEKSETAKK